MSEKQPITAPETVPEPITLFRVDIYHHAIARELTYASGTIPVDPHFHLDDYEGHDPHFDNDVNI